MNDDELKILNELNFVPSVCENCGQDASSGLSIQCSGCGLTSAPMGMCIACVINLYRVMLAGGYFTCTECPGITRSEGFHFSPIDN